MERNIWIDRLRSFLTVLVVAHHSSLAYTTFANFDKTTYINSTAPVVDPLRWIGLDIFENFNDIFFMSLMFFISGLFVVKSIDKKGIETFLSDRLKRLGIPFIVGVCLIIPIAYIPSYYLANQGFSLKPFIRDFLFHQQWPVGPPWFIWVLLAFNIIAVIIPLKIYKKLSTIIAAIAKRPVLFILAAFTLIGVAYIPLTLQIGAAKWTGWWPFDFQLNRVFLYFLFFSIGVILGASDWNGYMFANEKLLEVHWSVWLITCILFYAVVELFSYYGKEILNATGLSDNAGYIIYSLFYVASCIASSFGFIAYFQAKQIYTNKFWTSLSSNAFGIYLVHYVFVTWIQFWLLDISMPVIIKFLVVFIGSLSDSWLVVSALRKIRVVKKII